jgi:dUTP pyrophosphatase
MEVKIINKSDNKLPAYETSSSAGMDLRAYLPEGPITLKPMQRTLVPTGLFMEIPEGYEGQVRPRSGLAIKSGITVLNTPGTIDADYRGEVKIILINLSDTDFVINSGDRVAQIVFAKCEQMEVVNVDTLSDTERGEGGFGHTGRK